MHLLPVTLDKWKLYTPCNQNGDSELLDFLEGLDKKFEKDRAKLLNLFEYIGGDVQGPRLLPTDISHHVDKDGKIFQLRANRLRLLYFYSEREQKVIICSHSFVKKSKKTPAADRKKAEEVRAKYHEAVVQGKITIVDE